jgi:hypothetical protein
VVAVRVWDLAGQFPLGVQSVSAQVLQRAEELAQARGAVQVQGQVRVALRDLDLAQVEAQDSEWVQAQERESALPQGYRLDSEQGLVRDLVQVTELELG